MRIFFDTEFIDDGKTIDLISIGMVREDNREYYAEIAECDHSKACPWVKKNVLNYMTGAVKPRAQVAQDIVEFSGISPRFYGWFPSYDWVALCQLYGRMLDLPLGWPMFPIDLKAAMVYKGLNGRPPLTNIAAHHALADANWTMEVWKWLDDPAL